MTPEKTAEEILLMDMLKRKDEIIKRYRMMTWRLETLRQLVEQTIKEVDDFDKGD